MAQGRKVRVSMNFSDVGADGTIDEWVTFSLRDAYTDPLGGLDFECRPARSRLAKYRKLLRKGSLVTIFVNGVNQGGFIIQEVRTRVSIEDGVVINLSCRSPLIAAYQGSADPDFTFRSRTDTPVTDFISRVLTPYGITDVIGDSRLNVNAITGKPLPGSGATAIDVTALKHQEAQVQDGETAYALCARILTRLGACLRFVADNQVVVVSRPDYEQEPAYTIVQSSDLSAPGDRIIGDIEITETNDGQFSECRVRGQRNDTPGATTVGRPDATVQAVDVVSSLAAYSSEAQAYKPLIIRDKSCRDPKRALSVAKMALGGRAKDAFVLTCEVDGLVSQTGRIWQVDTVVTVRVDAIEFNSPMWVAERVLMQDVNGGQRCRLTLIPLGALVLGDVPG